MTSISNKKFSYPTGFLGLLADFLIVGIIFSIVVYWGIQNHQARKIIVTEGAAKYSTYVSQYIKANPDMVEVIEGHENCYSGKVYKIKGCHNYMAEIASEEQQIKLMYYLVELNKIKIDVQNKLDE